MTDPRSQPDRLAEHLDRLMPPGGRPRAAHDADPLADLALRLSQASHPALSEDAIARIEARLDAQMAPAVEPSGGHALAALAGRARWMICTISLILVLAVVLVPLTASAARYLLSTPTMVEGSTGLGRTLRGADPPRLASAGWRGVTLPRWRFELSGQGALVDLRGGQVAQAAALTGRPARVERTSRPPRLAPSRHADATGVLPLISGATAEYLKGADGGAAVPLPPIPTCVPR
jgi:hypothetical protein